MIVKRKLIDCTSDFATRQLEILMVTPLPGFFRSGMLNWTWDQRSYFSV
jgi:hypothetical protein